MSWPSKVRGAIGTRHDSSSERENRRDRRKAMEKEKKQTAKQRRRAFEIFMGTNKVGNVRVEYSLPVPWQMKVETKTKTYFLYRIKEDLWLVKARNKPTEKRILVYPEWMNPWEKKLVVVYINRKTIFVEAVAFNESIYLTNKKRVDLILQHAEDLKIYS
jgi:hypothetical protein